MLPSILKVMWGVSLSGDGVVNQIAVADVEVVHYVAAAGAAGVADAMLLLLLIC